jgi:hypothetical protein
MTKSDLTFGAALLAFFATIIAAVVLEAGWIPGATANHDVRAAVRQVPSRVAQADCACIRVAQQTVC